ncbi:hypothetical protein [Haloplasma contractile]|uniref:Uncharacterized protein n=1 Tax=Haloplasma contractile SSD-17B TaxID=1033810 RepID=F7PT64_9MOLU|nr:hypothetical protein [Haloplasma contractile]ERJ12521.1 hypothetical protein HLPCO_001507 [Haloplasma contractile SSD-17B]
MNLFNKYRYDMDLLRDNFWSMYLKSNSPSKCLYDKQDKGDHHWLLNLWIEFLNDDDKVKMLFWNNDELSIAPTHFFSKLYENELATAIVFERRCVGYLCSFLMQCRLLQEKDKKFIKGVRVANSVFKIKHGQVFV